MRHSDLRWCVVRGAGAWVTDRPTKGVFVESWEIVGDWPANYGFKVFAAQEVCAEE